MICFEAAPLHALHVNLEMLREAPTRRLHGRWRRRQRREVRGTPRRWRWRARGLWDNAHIAVVVRAWRRRRRIRLAVVAVLQAGGRRAGRVLCGASIAIVAVRFAGVIRVRFIANVRGAGCGRRRLVDDLVVPVRTSRPGRRRWRWIDGICHHAAAIRRRTRGSCNVIAIVGVHAVPGI